MRTGVEHLQHALEAESTRDVCMYILYTGSIYMYVV